MACNPTMAIHPACFRPPPPPPTIPEIFGPVSPDGSHIIGPLMIFEALNTLKLTEHKTEQECFRDWGQGLISIY